MHGATYPSTLPSSYRANTFDEPFLIPSAPFAGIVDTGKKVPADDWAAHLAKLRLRYVPTLLLSVFVPFTYWSTSGMESSLAALASILAISTVAAWVDDTETARWPLGIAATLSIIATVTVRPETPLVLLGSLGGLLVVQLAWLLPHREGNRSSWKRTCRWGLVATATQLALMTFRYLNFGIVFPNPAITKAGGLDFDQGAKHLFGNAELASTALSLGVVVGALGVAFNCFKRRVPSVLVMATLYATLQVGFVWASGGDWMPAGRLLVPAASAFVLLIAAALDIFAIRLHWGTLLGIAGFLGFATHGAMRTFDFARQSSNSSLPLSYEITADERNVLAKRYGFFDLYSKGHRRDAWLLEALLPAIRERMALTKRPFTMMSGQAGMVPYYVFREFYGKGRFLDGFSLTSTQALRCIPARYKHPLVHGIQIAPQFIFDHSDKLAPCGLARPDVWFSTGNPPDSVRKNGFQLVYRSRPGADKAWAAVAKEQ